MTSNTIPDFITTDEDGILRASGGERVYLIPEKNLSTFQDKLAKLVKRAIKLQVEQPSYQVVHEDYITRKVETDERDELGQPIVVEHLIKRVWITLQHAVVIVSGYEFVCKLEHTDDGNILHVLPGKTVPSQYRECGPNCDHCKVNRKRNDTFILLNFPTGELSPTYIQVGRQCLADFLGRSAENAAWAAEMYASLGELAEASEDYGGEGGGGGPRYEMLDRYLAYVAEVISCVGWKSRTVAREYGGAATADIAMSEMYKRRYNPSKDLFDHPTAKAYEMAKEAIEWAENIGDDEAETSDYLWNLRVIARRGVVGSKQFGIAGSAVAAYQKHLGLLEKKKRQAERPSEWVGEVGKRQIFTLLVEKVITIDGMYTSYLHIMSDPGGNKVLWFSSGDVYDAGKTIVLKGTVKKHGERKGVRQTILSRCEEVEIHTYLFTHHIDGKQDASYEVEAVSEKEAKAKLFQTLNVKRMPKGMTVLVKKPQEVPEVDGKSEEMDQYVQRAHLSDQEYEARCESEEARRYEERAYGRD